MIKFFNIAVIVSTAFLMSCGGNNGPETDKSIMPDTDSAKVNSTTIPQTSTIQSSQTIQAVPDQPVSGGKNIVMPTTSNAVPATTAPGMNPPHGQPGHRCEIAVGAPLNSAPASAPVANTTSSPAITTTPVATPATPAAAPTITAPGMNPPHGQPGHDCSIAVGAPLKKG